MKDKLKFIQAGSEVTRYHTVKTLTQETVGHHSHGVAMICIMLMGCQVSADLLKAALCHDLAEHQLGDIPSPAKREYGIGEQVNELEDKLLNSVGLSVQLTPDEATVLKLADIAQGALFCVREMELGNSGMKVVYERYRSYAEGFVLLGRERELFDIIHQQFLEAVK